MSPERLRRDHKVFVISLVVTAVRHFIPPVGHLMPQAETQGEIRPQLHLILEIPGAFGLPVSLWNRSPDHGKIGWDILEKSRHRRITDASCRRRRRPDVVFVYPLHPTAGAKVVRALGEAQVTRQAVVLSGVAKGVVAGRPRD